MTHVPGNDYSILSESHLAAFRLAVREKRSHDATREMRRYQGALAVARAIATYEKEIRDGQQ